MATDEEGTMTADTITALAARAADVAAAMGDEWNVTGVEMGEYADGSRRHFALIHMNDGDLEQTFRVMSPAPWDSPAWASHYTEWVEAVRVGDGWAELAEA